MQEEERINRTTPSVEENLPDSSMGSGPESGSISGDNMDPVMHNSQTSPGTGTTQP